MSRQTKKTKLLGILITLVVAIAPLTVWLVSLEKRRALSAPPFPFGSAQEIIAVSLLLAIFIAIIIIAVKLQKAIDEVIPGKIDFPRLSHNQQIKPSIAQGYFNQAPPRPFNEEIFKAVWNGILPPPVRVLLWSLVPLTIAMMSLFIFMALWVSEDSRQLDKGPVTQVQGQVINVQKKNSRDGSYYEIFYQFAPNPQANLIKGTSYADHKAFNQNDRVNIEYLNQNKRISRIIGLRTMPTDITLIIMMVIVLTILLIPAIVIYLWWKKGFTKAMLCHGVLLEAQIEKVKKGGKGMIFAEVSYHLNGIKHSKKLSCPAVQELFPVLSNRQSEHMPIKVLVHPQKYRYAYLIEPHLS